MLTALLAVGLTLTAACGSTATASSPESTRGSQPVVPATAAQRVTVVAHDSMRFEPVAITVRAGQPVQLTLDNRGMLVHDFILGEGVPTPVKVEARPGQGASATFTVERPGTYTFACTVPGHGAAGMTGTITAR